VYKRQRKLLLWQIPRMLMDWCPIKLGAKAAILSADATLRGPRDFKTHVFNK